MPADVGGSVSEIVPVSYPEREIPEMVDSVQDITAEFWRGEKARDDEPA